MDSQVVKLAEETLGRYDALTEELSDPNIFNDQRRYAEVAKEHAKMRRGAEMSRELLDAVEAEREARELVPQLRAEVHRLVRTQVCRPNLQPEQKYQSAD